VHDLLRRLTTIEMAPKILPVWSLAMLLLTIHTTTGRFAFAGSWTSSATNALVVGAGII